MKKLFFPLILTAILFSLPASGKEGSVEGIMSDRKSELKQAKKKYQEQIEEINKKTLEKLGILLRSKIVKKEFAEAKKIQEAISSILESKTPLDENQNAKTAKNQSGPKKSGILKSTLDENFPEGTFRQFGHHYHQLPFKMNRIDAEKICKNLGGHLLSVDTPEEYKFFHEYSVKNKKPLWLDIFRKNNEWTNWKGDKAKFLKWFDGKYETWPDSDYIAINVNNSKSDMVKMRGTKFSNFAICEWDK
jgi:hypothetical protein